ncbi:MAG: DUF4293 domain-containing protein [Bacteroidetes bacterium]|nr:DUF4293 domain-containing protein [Bacteroidota bacterium]
MLQRIQSVYLLLAAICAGLCFPLPFWEGRAGIEGESVTVLSVDLQDNLILFEFTFFIGLTCFVNIFLFKNRPLQITISWLIITLSIILLTAIGYFILRVINTEGSLIDQSLRLGMALPVLIIIFLFLARKGIKKDEDLVRSADRLR